MTKEKALYQTKLILDCLPSQEYDLIPKDLIEYIKTNMEYDKNIKIDPNIEIEEQDIDEKTYQMLDKILKRVETNLQKDEEKKIEKDPYQEIMTLKNIILNLQKENGKITEAKKLVVEYKKEVERLNNKCKFLEQNLHDIPNFIKVIFIKKSRKKYLEERKEEV